MNFYWRQLAMVCFPVAAYFIVWICFREAGHTYSGMAVGVLAWVITTSIAHRMEFGAWKF